MLIFNKYYVDVKNKGYAPGDVVPEGLLTATQAASLIDQGYIREVIKKEVFVKPEVPVVVELEDEEEVILDPIEALDPERKARKRK